jgi:hypothetical protein
MRPAAPAALALLLAGAVACATGAGGPIASGAALVLDAEVVWREADPRFGGFSGLTVEDDGARLVAISDRAAWATARLARSDGRLTGVTLTGIGPLRAISGDVLVDQEVDAEGLATGPDGAAYLSFEAFHRIRRYPRIDGPAEDVPGHPDFRGLQVNSALEALAIDAEGTLYAIPERSGKLTRPFPVYRYRDGRWDSELRLRRDGAFLVAGADFGPDGRLYVLERDFRWYAGFATRIRSFSVGPDGLGDVVTLLQTDFGELDNMEGISVWRDGTGRTRLTLISDDNFLPIQKTVIVEYVFAGS